MMWRWWISEMHLIKNGVLLPRIPVPDLTSTTWICWKKLTFFLPDSYRSYIITMKNPPFWESIFQKCCNSQLIFFIFAPKIGEDEPILTSIFFKWVVQPPTSFNFFQAPLANLRQIIFFTLIPYLGKMNPFWRAYCSDGLVQPPSSDGMNTF